MVFAYHAYSLPALKYLIPVFLLVVPYAMQGRINLAFSAKDSVTGIAVSAAILLPFWYFALKTGRHFGILPVNVMAFQLLGVSFPEEIFFRGFLQQRLGNNIRGVLVVSILFSAMHVPQLIFHGDLYSILTFFPSLVMGGIYLKTHNVLPAAIFHFLSNIVFLGFYDIL